MVRGERKELRLDDAMFVMPELGPRIGEEDEQFGKLGVRRERFEKQCGLGLEEVEVGELCPIALAPGPRDAFAGQVHPDANVIRMGGGIRRQKVSVTASQFPDERGG